MNVLISPDKFKGTLSAEAAATAIARGWHKGRPKDELTLAPISDGGDGFGRLISRALQAKLQTINTLDAAHWPRTARWWWHSPSRTAVIESAEIIGLALLGPGRFHPFELDTFGLGAVIKAAAAAGARRCLIGIGGSATNDGGFGLARALGWQFFDRDGLIIKRWIELANLARIRPPERLASQPASLFEEVIVAVDVQNPLLGPKGATRVYGPQKGLREGDFAIAERCLQRLAQKMKQQFGKDISRLPGAGAAGGLGFGLAAFLNARLEPGFDLFARYAKLDRDLRRSDLVITGEGAIDHSTFMGKGVGRLAQRCRAMKLPCVAFAGRCEHFDHEPFAELYSLTELTNLTQARARPAYWLARLSEQTARNIKA